MNRIIVLIVLLVSFLPSAAHAAEERCVLAEGYLEQITADVDKYGQAISEVNPDDVVAMADFMIELMHLRAQYMDMVENVPECGLRLHTYFLALITNMQERAALAIALDANPDRSDLYLQEIDAITKRLTLLVDVVQLEIEHILKPPPLAIRYVDTEAINVREGRGADYDSLGVLEQNDRIEVITIDLDEFNRVWYEFYFEDGTGWILGELTIENPR